MDKFHGEEINSLPEKVADRFYQVTRNWPKLGQVPFTMREIAQASMHTKMPPCLHTSADKGAAPTPPWHAPDVCASI